MTNRAKNALYSIVLVLAVVAVYFYRANQQQEAVKIEGATMGTSYHITYFDREKRNFKDDIDSLLLLVNRCINTYDPSSDISRFNYTQNSVRFELPYFYPPLAKSLEVVKASGGAYDPTVMPLVNAWGFGPAKPLNPDSLQVDSIRRLVGFEKLQFNRDSVWKLDPRVQLDFGGIGQGYGADVIVDFLTSKGIKNMLVELGGEGMAIGKNLETGKPWEIGILDPNSDYANQFFIANVSLRDQSFTTSGNYFNYRIVNGQKFSHTIDPATGFPVEHNLLSASVFAQDGATADAWATALMVMGLEKAKATLQQHPELQGFLIYSEPDGLKTFSTEGIRPYLTLNR